MKRDGARISLDGNASSSPEDKSNAKILYSTALPIPSMEPSLISSDSKPWKRNSTSTHEVSATRYHANDRPSRSMATAYDQLICSPEDMRRGKRGQPTDMNANSWTYGIRHRTMSSSMDREENLGTGTDLQRRLQKVSTNHVLVGQPPRTIKTSRTIGTSPTKPRAQQRKRAKQTLREESISTLIRLLVDLSRSTRRKCKKDFQRKRSMYRSECIHKKRFSRMKRMLPQEKEGKLMKDEGFRTHEERKQKEAIHPVQYHTVQHSAV